MSSYSARRPVACRQRSSPRFRRSSRFGYRCAVAVAVSIYPMRWPSSSTKRGASWASRTDSRTGSVPVLRFGFALQQFLHCGFRGGGVLEHATNTARDGHVDTQLGRKMHDGARGANALGNVAQIIQDRVEWLALSETESHPAIARQVPGAGQDEIAHAREAHERFG